MNLTKTQRDLLRSNVLPKLATLGLRGTIIRYVNPEDGVSAEDCLVVDGSKDGPYRTSKRVGALLLEIDDAFADLLIMKGLDRPVAESGCTYVGIPIEGEYWIATGRSESPLELIPAAGVAA